MEVRDKSGHVIGRSNYGMGSSSASCSTAGPRDALCHRHEVLHQESLVGTCLRSTNLSDLTFERAQLLLGVVSKQIHNPLLHGAGANNLPSRVARCHLWDERRQDQNQSLLEMRRDLTLGPACDDRASQPLPEIPSNH